MAQIFCGFNSRKTRLNSTQTFYGSAFAASAAAPRGPGPFVPRPIHYTGPFLPRIIRSFVSRAVPGQLTKKEQCLYFLNFFVPLTFYFFLFFTVGLVLLL